MSLLDAIGSDIAEREVRQTFEKAFRKSADRNEDGRTIVKNALFSQFDKRNPLMKRAAAKITEFSIPAFGIMVKTVLTRTGFIDSILPGDDRAGVKTAKFLLKRVAPLFIVAAAEAYGDAIERTLESQVSDPVTTPEANRTKPLDRLVVSRLLPGRIFIPEVHDDGTIRIVENIPVIADPAWQAAFAAWEASHAATAVPGKPRGPETRFPFELVSFEMAAQIAESGGATNADVDRIAALRRAINPDPGKTGYAALNEPTKRVMKAFAVTMARLGAFDYDQTEDIMQDMFEFKDGQSFNATRVNMLETFVDDIQTNGMFTQEKLFEIVAYTDTFLGGKRNLFERARRILNQFRIRQRIQGMGGAVNWLWRVGKGILVVTLLFLIVFLACASIFSYGVFGSGVEGVKGVIIDVRCLIFGAVGMMTILAITRLADIPLNLLARLFVIEYDTITKFGKYVSAGIGVLTALMIFSKTVSLGPAIAGLGHYIILGALIGGFGATLGLSAGGWESQRRLWYLSAMKTLKILAIVMLGIALFISIVLGLRAFGVHPGDWAAKMWSALWDNFYKNPLLASVVLLTLYSIGVMVFLRSTRRLRGYVRGGTLYVNELSGGAKLAVLLAGAAFTLLPWFPFKQWPEEGKETAGDVELSTPDVGGTSGSGGTDFRVPDPVSTPRPMPVAPRQTGKKPFNPKTDCVGMTYQQRQWVPACRDASR